MFTREDTRVIKGIAVVFMLFHHLAGFPKRFPVGFEGFSSLWQGFVDNGYLQGLAHNGGICVSLFFFLGGYGLYKRWESGKFSLSQSIFSIYKQYWKVFIIFIPIAFLFFARTGDDINILATRYVIASKRDFITSLISNFLGVTCSFNSEWWFFSSYLCVLPLGCLLLTATKNHQDFLKDIFIVILINLLICNVFPNLTNTVMFSNINSNVFYSRLFLLSNFASCFFEGIVFAKYDAVAAIKRKVKSVPLNKAFCVFGLAVISWCRLYIEGSVTADLIYVPFVAALMSNFLDGLRVIKKAFSFLGKYSTSMWLIHSFYCYYFLEATKLVYSTRIVWVDLLILTAMSLATAVFIDCIYKGLNNLWDLYARKKQGDAGAEPPAP